MTKKPHKSRKIRKKNGLSEPADEDLWGHVAATVAPLGKSLKNRTPDVENKPVPTGPGAANGKSASRTAFVVAQSAPRRSALPELSVSSQPGLDKSTAKKLKKGVQKIEARMDLHGMTQTQAHRALDSFIDGSYGAGKRCVLVITGKGLKPDGSVGVIRAAVPRWLNEQPNRGRVLAFTHATPKDGGEGALYVMLKRKR
jgi:DNA-nicking Smr family endonuclease